LTLIVLLAMTAIGVALCALILSPFVPALTWAFALAVVADPLHQRILRYLRHPNLAAAASVLIVTVLLLIPTVFVGWQIGVQAGRRFDQVQARLDSGSLRELLAEVPAAQVMYDRLTGNGAHRAEPDDLGPAVQRRAEAWMRTALWAVLQIAIAMFVLFFLFRDREHVLAAIRSYLPMSRREATYFFDRLHGMTHATLYGTVMVALLQGGLGGIMFAILGIPGALLWGFVMAVLAIVPSAGAFLIWIPAAIVLAIQGAWIKALILAAWGTLVVGTVDNLVYPALVGREVRMHTLPVFFAIVGGLFAFGAPGVVLGPVVVAGTIAVFEILKRRTARQRSAMQPR
jgi:predicted PurR-regulated permease PerM